MQTNLFSKKIKINAPINEVFKWHEQPGAIERLTPPWEPMEVIRKTGGIRVNDEVLMRLKIGPARLNWLAQHTDYKKDNYFKDTQIKGPFSKWIHSHLFHRDGKTGCILEDNIEYRLPVHRLSSIFLDAFVKKKLSRMFTYRHAITLSDIETHHGSPFRQPLNILISGASGLLGRSITPFFTTGGHRVIRLVRHIPDPTTSDIYWNPETDKIGISDNEKIDVIIHLAGENIGEGRWTKKKKKRIIESRTKGTSLISDTIRKMKNPPKVFLCASAIGYYGNRGDTILSESDCTGNDFISNVCHYWEDSADTEIQKKTRVVFLRIGIVLTPQGGALKKLLPSFQIGMGGKISSGKQYMSWISIDDAIGAIFHALCDQRLEGPVNVVSPNPVTNEEFTATLGNVLSRPTLFNFPKHLINFVFGEMGRETILSSTRVKPDLLQETGYKFKHSNLESALNHVLGKNIAPS